MQLVQKTIFTWLLLTVWTVGAQETESPYSAWQVADDIQLPASLATDAQLNVIFAEGLLLVASPALRAEGCGSVQVFSEGQNGSYNLVQSLSAANFGRQCFQEDGFGFSMDYENGLLIVGAPGLIFPEGSGGQLVAGKVFAYRLGNATRFQPVDVLNGPGLRGNMAWGTKVETDGTHVLVQGNERGTMRTESGATVLLQSPQGFANPRSVNLLRLANNGNLVLDQSFSKSGSTLYGQDFIVGNNLIFISEHSLATPLMAGFVESTSNISIFGLISSQNTASPSTTNFLQDIERETLFSDGSAISDINYIDVFQAGNALTLNIYQLQQEGLFTAALIATYETCKQLALVSHFQCNSNISSGISCEPLPPLTECASSDGTVLTDKHFAFRDNRLINLDDDSFGRKSLVTRTSQVSNNREFVQEYLLNTRESPAIESAELVLGDGVFAIVSITDEENRIQVRSPVAGLDPAITQAWWFGPAFAGQGVTLEVLQDNRLLMHWFTYDLSGNQMWVRGVGRLENGEINMPLVRAMGPRFPVDEFNPDDRVVQPWGNAILRFDSCTSGTLSYQSDEFGDGQLPLQPLVDNGFNCDSGFIRDATASFRQLSLTGSFFDPSRSGEGIILMPVPTIEDESRTVSRVDRAVGLWLTYTATGEQAWYYLGVYARCNPRVIAANRCVIEATQTPRNTMGPIFGAEYNPDDRVSVPWGEISPIRQEGFAENRQLLLPFMNPDGEGVLRLEQLTHPLGYLKLQFDPSP